MDYPDCAYDGCRGCGRCMQASADAALERENAELKRKLDAYEVKLHRAEEDRAYYQREVHEASERQRAMTSAASSAAATTVTALERIQEMEKVVLAAEHWVDGGAHGKLVDAVKEWRRLKRMWS